MKTLEEIRQRCVITDDGHWLWKGATRPDGRPNIWAPDYTRGGMATQCGTRAVWHCSTEKAIPEGWRAYPLDGANAQLTGLTIGARYWLGTAGGVTATPLDETDVANVNKISQYLGVAKSTTELVTDDQGYVVL